jgi:hypothetical protein
MFMRLLQNQKRIFLFLFFLCILLATAQAEKISFRFSLNSYSMREGDLNAWIKSYNSLWKNWQEKNGGILQGQFNTLNFSPSFNRVLL